MHSRTAFRLASMRALVSSFSDMSQQNNVQLSRSVKVVEKGVEQVMRTQHALTSLLSKLQCRGNAEHGRYRVTELIKHLLRRLLGHNKLKRVRILASPHRVLHDEPLDALQHHLRPPHAPLAAHLLLGGHRELSRQDRLSSSRHLGELGHKEERKRQCVDVVLESIADDVSEAGNCGTSRVEGVT